MHYINVWWLALIIPGSASFGAFLMGLLAAGKKEYERMEAER